MRISVQHMDISDDAISIIVVVTDRHVETVTFTVIPGILERYYGDSRMTVTERYNGSFTIHDTVMGMKDSKNPLTRWVAQKIMRDPKYLPLIR